MKRLCLCALALFSGGCLLQGGPQAGATIHAKEERTEGTWGGQLTAAVDLAAYDVPVYVGAELSARSEHAHGSGLRGGIQLGPSFGDARSTVRFNFHLDAGLALGWSAAPAWYVGPSFELPIRLQEPPPLGERNRNFRVLGSAPWLVPFVSYRLARVEPTTLFPRSDTLHELSGGLALRMSYESDFL